MRALAVWLLLTSACLGATGEVVSLGTPIGNMDNGSNTTLGDGFDYDYTTFARDSSANGAWIGRDLGTAGTVTRWRFAPKRKTSSDLPKLDPESRVSGGKIQISSSSTFASDVTDVDEILSTDQHYWSFDTWERLASGASSKQYVRYLGADGTNGDIAEVEFLVAAGPTAAKPDRPTISPWGGNYSSGSVTVTLASLTTSASIYYTVDGSTPDSGDNLYSGPFSLDVTGGVTLKAIAIDGSLGTTDSEVSVAEFRDKDFVVKAPLADQLGRLIQAHGGCILKWRGGEALKVGGYYYMYGSNTNIYNVNPGFVVVCRDGVQCYKSTDLINWQYVGQVLKPPSYNASGDNFLVAPSVSYNVNTDKYVMWCNTYLEAPIDNVVAVVATADDPEGPWTVTGDSPFDPDGTGLLDFDTFVDDDDTAYLVHEKLDTSGLVIVELDSDYTGVDGSPTVIWAEAREGVGMAKIDGRYVVAAGLHNFYDSGGETSDDPFHTRAISSTSLFSGWTTEELLITKTQLGNYDYNSQIFDLVRVGNQLLAVADWWKWSDMYQTRNAWYPVFHSDSHFFTPHQLIHPSWDMSLLTQTQHPTLSDGLVMFVNADENAGTPVDVYGEWHGSGTLTNSSAWNASGKINAALDLNATDYVQLPDKVGPQTGLTISAWIYQETADTGLVFAMYDDETGDSPSAGAYAQFIIGGDGSLAVRVLQDNSNFIGRSCPASTISLNTWHHVLYTWDGTNTSAGIDLYVDNVAVDNGDSNGGTFTAPSTTAIKPRIGAQETASAAFDFPFPGRIDMFGMWNRELTTDEISAIYNGGDGFQYPFFVDSQATALLNVLQLSQ